MELRKCVYGGPDVVMVNCGKVTSTLVMFKYREDIDVLFQSVQGIGMIFSKKRLCIPGYFVY